MDVIERRPDNVGYAHVDDKRPFDGNYGEYSRKRNGINKMSYENWMQTLEKSEY